ncbi:hypothetical protein PNOK_0302600 [Pyrrhoderma noxium]|uniref:Uncharacterized protein n=1 Tax=Pyrrhoderma noxium TaxID=2282107 RepID=A0A286ULI7_9AGAM|nr:hypothetical protein PNOK_0302600 [Pyrrhoderma noxium]
MDQVAPTTPQRGRNVYPSHLGVRDGPRVPLHRRGTSRTYECLEDLLREAGFKETRVFTPETERQEAQEGERKGHTNSEEAGGEKEGKSTATGLVGFLTGFINWNEGGQKLEGQRSSRVRTQSLGRAAGKQKLITLDDEDEAASMPGTPTPNRQRPFVPVILTSDFSSPGSSSSASSVSPPQQQPYQQFSYTRKQRSNYLVPNTQQGAAASLRHMISAPEFAHSRAHQTTNMRRVTTASQGRPKKHKVYHEGNDQEHPPLPQNWLSTVTQAVMNASGAHVGGPRGRQLTQSKSHSRRVESLYEGRSDSGTRKGFAPRTPVTPSIPGVITPASVVCRSAPASRSSSLVRKRSSRGVRNRDPEVCVPSLGVTTVVVGDTRNSIPLNDDDVIHEQTSIESDDESDDGYLDFARLLVPSRRQHSIHSLRRHLHNHAIAAGTSMSNQYLRQPRSGGNARSRQSSAQDEFADDDPLFMVRSRASFDEDAENDALADWAANGLPGLETAVQKKRGTLPWSAWKQGR